MNFYKSNLIYSLVIGLVFSSLLNAQSNNLDKRIQQETENNYSRCATDQYNADLLKRNPTMMGSQAFEDRISRQIQINKKTPLKNRRALQYTIPVVVHVIHNGEAIGVGANISEAQVISQIQVLNDDFRKALNSNGYNTNPVGADVEIEFCLAKQTEKGCITNGINRIDMSSVSASWDGPETNSNTETILKPSTIWDPAKYMNVWTVNFSNASTLGYAQFPGTLTSSTDGVVCGYQYFGSNDDPDVTITGNFNLGRTMTHEVGHYLGLYHTFQGGCSETDGGDQCADTPAVASDTSNNSVCASNNSCPTGDDDMIENYMDYSTDACMNVFTENQKARIISTMMTASNRPSSLTSSVCTPLVDVSYDCSVKVEQVNSESCSLNFTPNVGVTNWGTQTLTSASISYNLDGGASTNYNWTGSLGFGEFEIINLPTMVSTTGNHTLNASISNPNGNLDSRSCNNTTNKSFDIDSFVSVGATSQVHLNLTPDNFGAEITWEFRDSNNAIIDNGGPYMNGDTTVISQSFNVSTNECYTFAIFDSNEDGICCTEGAGSYNLKTDDDTIIASGAEFGSSAVTRISTTPLLEISDYWNKNEITLFPNPVKDFINLKMTQLNNLPDNYIIYNLRGQMIIKRVVNTTSDLKIDASTFSNGIYFIKVYKEGNSISIPFIKE